MTEIKSNLKPTIYAFYGLGLVLVLLGAAVTAIGFKRAGETRVPVTAETGAEPGSKPDPIAMRPTYRLRYADESWSIQHTGGGTNISLPPFLPGPTLCAAPRGAVPIEEIQSVFLDCMERNRFPLTRERYTILTGLMVGEHELFSNRERLAALLPADEKPADRTGPRVEQEREPERTQPAAETGAETTTRLTAIPKRLDPNTNLFIEAMSEWKTAIAAPLQRAAPKPRGYPVSASLPTVGEVQVLFAKRARERVLSNAFGATKRDKAIYLQALFSQNGENILVDGAFGNNSKKALGRWARQQFATEALAGDYQALVEAFFK